MSKEEVFQPPVDIDAVPAVAPASEAGLYSPEAHSFHTPEQAETWLNVAAREFSGHGTVSGIDARHFPVMLAGEDGTKPSAFVFSINMHDELGEQWAVEGKEMHGRDGRKWLSTSIACTTQKTGAGSYTSAVYRESGAIGVYKVSEDEHAYSVSKYDYVASSEDPKGYTRELTRTQPGELSEEKAAAAEQRYVEMVNQFKELLELKVANIDIDKIVKINQLAEAEMPVHHPGLLEKLHLAEVA